MMGLLPIRKPSTQQELFDAVWQVIDRLQSMTLLQSSTVQVDVRPGAGTMLNVPVSLLTASSDIGLYLVKTVFSDYLECQKCTLSQDRDALPVVSDETLVNVAKPFEFQPWLTDGKGLDGIAITFPWCSGATRRTGNAERRQIQRIAQSTKHAPDGITGEDDWHVSPSSVQPVFYAVSVQEIFPAYVPDKTVIVAGRCKSGNVLDLPAEGGGDAVQTDLLDITPGRCWMDLPQEVQGCFYYGPTRGYGAGYIRLRGSQPYTHIDANGNPY